MCCNPNCISRTLLDRKFVLEQLELGTTKSRMLFREKRIELVQRSDLEELISESIEEGREIDYKRDLPTPQTEQKKEFLHDVVSFANTTGGHICYGITESNQLPEEIVGVTTAGIEEQILRMDSWLRDGIAPRIAGTRIVKVPVAEGRVVVIIQIPRSWSSPHLAKPSSQFYARNSAGKYQLDVAEIRTAFVASESMGQQIRSFRADRLAKLIGNDFAIDFTGPAQVVLHVCPLISFTPGFQVDLAALSADERFRTQPGPLGANQEATSSRFIFDGRLLVSSRDSEPQTSHASSLFFRNGAIETVNSQLLELDRRSRFISEQIEPAVNETLEAYLALLSHFGVTPPWVVMLSLLNVRGYQMESSSLPYLSAKPIDRDHLILPEVLLDDDAGPITRVMRSSYDILWNACGMARCFLYNEQGDWTGRVGSD
ncbi:MAG: ATP-binding protein [Verrucomicrobiales bacterium]|nr:ATP-binding protein [Verrucomicrobiales bacterium]